MKLSHGLFFLLLALLPTQLTLHFWPQWAYLFGIGIDYLSPTVFFTDIIILGIFLSIRKIFIKRGYLVITILFIFLNSFFALQPLVAFFSWLQFLLHLWLGIYVYHAQREVIAKAPFFLSIGIIYSFIIAVAQFVKGESLGGVLYLIGERELSVSAAGISKQSLFGVDHLRPYATFPHPNAMAGFILLAGLFVYSRWEMKKGVLVYLAAIFTALLTFSELAIVAMLISILIYVIARKFTFQPTMVVAGMFIISVAFSFVKAGSFSIELSESIARRLDLNFVAGEVISQNYLMGVGLHNFTIALSQYISAFPSLRQVFWIQPVHNIFLLIFAEIGIVGIGAFLYLMTMAFRKVKDSPMLMGLSLIMITGLGDHYWVSLQQTQLLLIIFIAFLLSERDNILP